MNMGLRPEELTNLKEKLNTQNVMYSVTEDFFEIDMPGVDVLNFLAADNYRIYGQSMIIEKSNVGGGIVKEEQIAWTMGKE